MTQPLLTLPRCPLCRQVMDARDGGEDARWLGPEFVCTDVDCLEFGVYTLDELLTINGPSSPGGRVGIAVDQAR